MRTLGFGFGRHGAFFGRSVCPRIRVGAWGQELALVQFVWLFAVLMAVAGLLFALRARYDVARDDTQ